MDRYHFLMLHRPDTVVNSTSQSLYSHLSGRRSTTFVYLYAVRYCLLSYVSVVSQPSLMVNGTSIYFVPVSRGRPDHGTAVFDRVLVTVFLLSAFMIPL